MLASLPFTLELAMVHGFPSGNPQGAFFPSSFRWERRLDSGHPSRRLRGGNRRIGRNARKGVPGKKQASPSPRPGLLEKKLVRPPEGKQPKSFYHKTGFLSSLFSLLSESIRCRISESMGLGNPGNLKLLIRRLPRLRRNRRDRNAADKSHDRRQSRRLENREPLKADSTGSHLKVAFAPGARPGGKGLVGKNHEALLISWTGRANPSCPP
jgi:hypothetical protein